MLTWASWKHKILPAQHERHLSQNNQPKYWVCAASYGTFGVNFDCKPHNVSYNKWIMITQSTIPSVLSTSGFTPSTIMFQLPFVLSPLLFVSLAIVSALFDSFIASSSPSFTNTVKWCSADRWPSSVQLWLNVSLQTKHTTSSGSSGSRVGNVHVAFRWSRYSTKS